MTRLSNFELRPHHALCIQHFVGMGYNSDFVNEMKMIIVRLEKENPFVAITKNCDIICKKCPNKKNNVCSAECKVSKIDKACIEKCDFDFNDIIKWKNLKDTVYKNIISENSVSDVCKGCQWECWRTENFEKSFIRLR